VNKGNTTTRILNKLRPLLLIFALSLVGLGISSFVGSSIPFWMLLSFSLIFSTERWWSYYTRKYKIVGKLYRLALNLLVLSSLGCLVWSGSRLIHQQFLTTPLLSSLVFIVELIFFIWLCRIISKNKWRWPSMKLTVFSLLVLIVVFTFAGVQPLSTYKDNLVVKWKTYQTGQTEQREPVTNKTPEVFKPVELPPVSKLRNPTWSELKAFLASDDTDKHPYAFPTFVCANFASTLQENAKAAGWRCAVVTIRLSGYPDWYNYGISSNTEHALNAFETTDRGLVYIDCTRPAETLFTGSADTTVEVKVGQPYIPVSIWPTGGWSSRWLSCGIVEEIESVRW